MELRLPAGEGGAGAGLGAQPLTWFRSGVCAVLVCAAGLGLRSTEGAAFAGPQHSLGLGLLSEQCSSAAMPALCTRDPWGFLVPTTAEQGGAACHLPSQPGVWPPPAVPAAGRSTYCQGLSWQYNTNQRDLNVRQAWAQGYTGKGIVVSILDDGIEKNHPDLEGNYVSVGRCHRAMPRVVCRGTVRAGACRGGTWRRAMEAGPEHPAQGHRAQAWQWGLVAKVDGLQLPDLCSRIQGRALMSTTRTPTHSHATHR